MLDRADEEQVRVGATLTGPERGVDAVGRDDDLLARDPVEIDEVGFRPLGHGKDTRCATRRAWHDGLEDEAVFPGHQPRIAGEGEVVDRHDRRARAGERQRVLEMRERGA